MINRLIYGEWINIKIIELDDNKYKIELHNGELELIKFALSKYKRDGMTMGLHEVVLKQMIKELEKIELP